jgi:hypothetical protein
VKEKKCMSSQLSYIVRISDEELKLKFVNESNFKNSIQFTIALR